jgi:hypothetical protein
MAAGCGARRGYAAIYREVVAQIRAFSSSASSIHYTITSTIVNRRGRPGEFTDRVWPQVAALAGAIALGEAITARANLGVAFP